MSARFLRLRAPLVAVSLSILVAACGAKVTVDLTSGSGAHGTGGAGAQGGSFSSSSFNSTTTGLVGSEVSAVTAVGVGPTTTVGVGPSQCSCTDFCAVLQGCGAPATNCMSLCGEVTPGTLDCVCQSKASCNVQACFGVGTGGPGAAVSSSSGGPADPCTACINSSVQGPCAMALATCESSMPCTSILLCHQNCGWDPSCEQTCEGANPAGAGAFQAVVSCAVCQSCNLACQGTQIFDDYCLLP